MIKKEKLNFDIGIAGAGVLGLFLFKQLSELGYKTALFEKADKLAIGPSTRNEGMIHRGTRHAVSTNNADVAKRIVSRSIYGHEIIKQYAPESVNDIGVSFIAALTEKDDEKYIIDRWKENQVSFIPISKKEFKRMVPEANDKLVKKAFLVSDLSINTRILYQKLLHQGIVSGGKVFTDSEFIARDIKEADIVNSNGDIQRISAKNFVITTGYNIGNIYKQITGDSLNVRFWKSHLIVLPRLAKHGLIFVGNGETITAHQGNNSIFGQWEDATVVEKPNNEPIKEKAQTVFEAGVRAFPGAQKYKDSYMPVACIKPDIISSVNDARSVDVQIFTPLENYILALPGKMTEAPFLANIILQMIFNSNSDSMISERPLDNY